jgi:hypothetical protein
LGFPKYKLKSKEVLVVRKTIPISKIEDKNKDHCHQSFLGSFFPCKSLSRLL